MLRFFSLASRTVSNTRRTPGASTATGFSQKTCLPASIAAAEVPRTEVRRGGQDDDVDVGLHDLLVGVETGEAVVVVDRKLLGHILRLCRILDISPAAGQTIFEQVRHDGQLDIRVGTHRVDRGPLPRPPQPITPILSFRHPPREPSGGY